jgi:hypothetical protein
MHPGLTRETHALVNLLDGLEEVSTPRRRAISQMGWFSNDVVERLIGHYSLQARLRSAVTLNLTVLVAGFLTSLSVSGAL